MGMSYNITFHNATILPERYAEIAGWSPDEVAANPAGLQAAACEAINSNLDDYDHAVADEFGIHLDGIGFHDSASYSQGSEYLRILSHCEPGAYIHEIDEEGSSGEFWRHIVQHDRTIEIVYPVITWPDM